ncbi:MAG TPA: hypothetical protein VHU40_19105 [Polyangia bacterium]|nr:hypothetical protein [Polyangia bacterium]
MLMTKTMPRVLAGLAALAAFHATFARADEGATPSNTVEGSSPAETYTGQILMADGASVATLVAAGLIDSAGSADIFVNGLTMVGGVGLMMGGSIVHVTHGNGGRAAASLGLRLGLTVVGAAVGAGVANCKPNEFLCGIGETAVGSLLGLATAITIDAAVLARLRDTDERVTTPPQKRSSVALSPTLVATPTLAFAGLGGQF